MLSLSLQFAVLFFLVATFSHSFILKSLLSLHRKISFIKFYIYLWQRQLTVPTHPFFLPFVYSHITSMLSKYKIAKNKSILLSLLWSEAYNVTNYKSIWAEAGRMYVIFSSYIYNKGYDCSSSFSLTMDYIVDMQWAILDHEGKEHHKDREGNKVVALFYLKSKVTLSA